MCTHTGPFDAGTYVCTAGDHPENPGGHVYIGSEPGDE